MTAAAARRANTTRIGEEPLPALFNGPQKGSTTAYAGAIAVLNAGYLAPATTATALVCMGVFQQTQANAGADGAVNIDVLSGVFGPFANSAGGDAIAQASVGLDCYLVDDQTVALTSNTGARSKAGKIYKVTSDGVYVLMGLAI